MMTLEERYDMSYLRCVAYPPSIAQLRKDWEEAADELNPTGQVPEGREWNEFQPMFLYNHYVENVKFATQNYGQDFRTRKYTREELGYGWVNSKSKPIICKVVENNESELRIQWHKERPTWKVREIKFAWDGRY